MTRARALAMLVALAPAAYYAWGGVSAQGIFIAVSTALIIGPGVFLLARRDWRLAGHLAGRLILPLPGREHLQPSFGNGC